jgi:hypothetical protein
MPAELIAKAKKTKPIISQRILGILGLASPSQSALSAAINRTLLSTHTTLDARLFDGRSDSNS